MSAKFPNLHVVDHPLVQHKLSVMRDKKTSVKDFRALVGEIAMLLTYEATRNLPTTTKTIETPLCTCEVPVLAGKKMAIVPILRAGLGFEDGILTLIPSARVAHIGMYRDEETLEPHFYFLKYPKDIAERDVLIVDPMLATGGRPLPRECSSSMTAIPTWRSTVPLWMTTSTKTGTSCPVWAMPGTAFSAQSKKIVFQLSAGGPPPADLLIKTQNFLLRFAVFSCKIGIQSRLVAVRKCFAHGLQLSLGAALECFRSPLGGLEHFSLSAPNIGRKGLDLKT